MTKISLLVILVNIFFVQALQAEDSQLLKVSPLAINRFFGVQLSNPSIITKISFVNNGEKSSLLLGIFEGANDESFIDAIPLYMFTKETSEKEISISIKVSKPFKYIRFMESIGKAFAISNLEVYGYESKEEPEQDFDAYQPTNIPLISIQTEDGRFPDSKENDMNCNVIIINKGKVDVNKGGVKIRLRGNSTLNLPKKAFRIKFDQKTNVLGLPSKAEKWTLLSNYFDRTLLRNKITFKVSSLLGLKYTPACESVDLMVNSVYIGNYIICDQVEVGEGRLKLDKMDENSLSEPEISGGYLIEIDGNAPKEKSHFTSKQGVLVTIKYPDEDEIKPAQSSYIQSAFDSMEEKIYGGITDQIDMESFLNWFLVQEFCANIDTTWSSSYMFKERSDDKFYFGPIWDFDLALDNDVRLYPTNEKTDFCFKSSPSAGKAMDFLKKIVSNEKVLKALKEHWAKVKDTKIAKNTLLTYVKEQIKLIDESQKLNYMKWDTLNKKVALEPVVRGTYEAEGEYIQEFISKRYDAVTKTIESATPESVNAATQGGGGFPWGGGQWGGGQWGGGQWENGQFGG